MLCTYMQCSQIVVVLWVFYCGFFWLIYFALCSFCFIQNRTALSVEQIKTWMRGYKRKLRNLVGLHVFHPPTVKYFFEFAINKLKSSFPYTISPLERQVRFFFCLFSFSLFSLFLSLTYSLSISHTHSHTHTLSLLSICD